MKNRTLFIALLAVVALIVAACSGDASTEESTETTEAATETTEAMEDETSVVDLAIEAGGFETLVAAVQAAGLVEALEGEGPFTVLAPTDAAFDAAFEALGITADELLADTETLTAILTYHVLGQAADSQLVATLDGESVPTLNGAEVSISVEGGAIMVDDATVVSADLIADNGIVHVIDSVLLPPDVAEALASGGDDMDGEDGDDEAMVGTIVDLVIAATEADPAEFTILLEAVLAADLADVLAGDGPSGGGLTVFAPTDAAFAAALEALGITPEELLASEDLPTILAYHVVDGTFLAEDVVGIAPADVPTLADATVAIEVVDGSVMVNDATVVQADVVADNGVIHVIDTVLLPPSEG
jgi:transforming growth factor-beta-induced protein